MAALIGWPFFRSPIACSMDHVQDRHCLADIVKDDLIGQDVGKAVGALLTGAADSAEPTGVYLAQGFPDRAKSGHDRPGGGRVVARDKAADR